jgi:hypothetical protein
MARIHRYKQGNVSLLDTLVGTDVENQKATVNIPIAAVVDLAIDFFSTNGNGDGINQSLLDITTSIDGNTQSIATYQNIVNTLTNEFTSIVTRTETLESSFTTNVDGDITISTANITNFAETIAAEGFASATTLDSLSSQVQQIIDGQLTIDTYATIDQLANTTSTLTGSIATLEDTLTAGYQAYTDGILTTDAFASAVQGVEVSATDTFASSTQYTNLKANFGTFDANGNLLTLASSFANSVLTAYTDDTLATASDITTLQASFGTYVQGELATYSNTSATNSLIATATADMATVQDLTTLEATLETYVDGAITGSSNAGITASYLTTVLADYAEATDLTELQASIGTFDANGNITALSNAFSTQVTSAVAGEGYATTSSLNTLEASLTSYIDGEIASSSTAGITGSQLTTVLEDYAEATDLTALEASIGTFDANGNLTALSTAFANQVTSAVATDTFAEVTDLNELKAEIGTFDANGNLTGLSTAFSTELTDIIATENLASAQSVTDLTATVTQNNTTLSAGVSSNQSAIASVDGQLAASYGLNVTAGNAISGMTLLADGTTNLSEIKFVADKFSIEQPNGNSIAPFVLNNDGSISLNGAVTFSNSSSGSGISQTDLQNYLTNNNYTTTSDLPTEFTTTDLQNYLDDEGYESGGIDSAQLATYLSNGGYITDQTTISGGKITTGIIASQNFAMPTNSLTSGYSINGMGINLDNNSIHAKEFYINADGSANFGGIHSAGSIGSWTVDSSGALKDSSSEIVLDPSGSYTEVGTEKLVLSSEDLPAIAPSAATSAQFSLGLGTLGSGLSTSAYQLSSRTGSTTTSGSNPKTNKYFFSDITGTIAGSNTQGNIAYDAYGGGDFTYTIPYGAGPTFGETSAVATLLGAAGITFGFQSEFGKDYGWGSISSSSGNTTSGPSEGGLDDANGGNSVDEPTDGSGGLDYDSIPNITDIAGFDYTLNVVFKFYFVPDNGGASVLLKTETKAVASGSISKDLRDATSVILSPNNDNEYFGVIANVPGNWASGQIEGTYQAPTSSNIGTATNPGDIRVDSFYEYDFSNIYVWSAGTSTSGYDMTTPWSYIHPTVRQYLSSGEDLTNSFSNVLFTGATAKTNIGLNGIQVRGNKGFVALGDVVPGSANAVAQVWGNTQVFGTLTSNAARTFSDKNLKENIIPISNALDTVSKLEPVSFNWKPDMRGVDLGTRYGFIAQDMQEVLPTIVKEEEHLTLEHNNIISINTAAIKELVNEINELKDEIKTLKENNG